MLLASPGITIDYLHKVPVRGIPKTNTLISRPSSGASGSLSMRRGLVDMLKNVQWQECSHPQKSDDQFGRRADWINIASVPSEHMPLNATS
jgi:hypothetical protein